MRPCSLFTGSSAALLSVLLRLRSAFAVPLLLLAFSLLAASISHAQNAPAAFTVTSLVDDNPGVAANCNQTQNGEAPLPNCTLRDALTAITALGSQTSVPNINFASTLNTASGTITPTTTNPAIYALGAAGPLTDYFRPVAPLSRSQSRKRR